MKKLFIIIAAALFLAGFPFAVSAEPDLAASAGTEAIDEADTISEEITDNGTNTVRFIISDEAGLIKDDIQYLSNEAKKFSEAGYGYFVAFLTTDNTDGRTSVKYTDDYIDNYIAGGAGKDMLIFLIDMDNRELYIATAGIAIDIFSDSIIESMLDAAYDFVVEGEYYSVFSTLLEEAQNWTESYYNPGSNDYYDDYYYNSGNPYYNGSTSSTSKGAGILLALIIAITAAAITVFVITHRYKTIGVTGGLPYNMRKDLSLYVSLDTFSHRKVTERHIPPPDTSSGSSGSSGSSSGGSSSTHTTSGGNTAGGGGRSF